MSKEAFIRRLRELLAGLPQSEAAEAIQYYEDYFTDAGEENEAKVIEELGSPERVAANIRADLGMPQNKNTAGGYHDADTANKGGRYDRGTDGYDGGGRFSGTYGGSGGNGGDRYSGANADRYNGGGYSGADADGYNGGGYSGAGEDRYSGFRYEEPSKEKHTALWIVLAVCTCYLWIPLVIVAIVLVFVAVIAVCALSFSFAVTALALGVAGIAMVGVAIVKIFVSPAAGMLLLGSGLILAGLTIYSVYLVGLLFGKAMPAFFGWIGSFGRKARRRRGDAR